MKIFMSYARQDRMRAREIADAFESLGHTVDIDYGLSPGDDFATRINNELQSSDLVVVLWSKTSATSEWVRGEAVFAQSVGKLFPMALEPVDLPPPFNLTHTIDVRDVHGQDLANLIARSLPGAERKAASAKRRAPAQTYEQSQQAFETAPSPQRQQAPQQNISAQNAIPPVQNNLSTPAAPSAPAPPRPFDVFISYSRKDEAACQALFDLLVQRGLNPWYDKDIGSGAFKQKIFERISSVNVFALLLSKHSTASQNVSKELSMASQAGRLIVPISIDGLQASDLKDTFAFELVELNIFPVTPDAPASWNGVVDTIEASVRELSKTAPVPIAAPIAPAPEPPKRRGAAGWIFLTMLLGAAQLAAVGVAANRLFNFAPLDAALVAGAASIALLPILAGSAALLRIAFAPR